MTTPRIDLGGLARPAIWEYALRFIFGGLVTAGALVVSKQFGTAFGGMFLAFPAILPASLTLVKRHDGRKAALADSRGSRLGAIALVGFGIVVAATATLLPLPLVLALATVTWLAVAAALWWLLMRGE